jgi:hypothetical protein
VVFFCILAGYIPGNGQGVIQCGEGGGIYPRHEFDMGEETSFFGNVFSGFENLITLNVILRHLVMLVL